MENVNTLSIFFCGELQSWLEHSDYIYVVSVFQSLVEKKFKLYNNV